MRVILTGGCGFIGSNLTGTLLTAGHKVKIVDNLTRGSLRNIEDRQGIEFVNADVRDEVAMRAALRGADALIHLAAYGSVVESLVDPSQNFAVNVKGTLSVLEAARQEGVSRVIFASTGGALMGNAIPPVDEKTLPQPISPYGASKLAGEAYGSAYAHSFGVNFIALRFANVLGPRGLHKRGVISTFFKSIVHNQPITIYGDGNATRDFIFVEDLCSGIRDSLTLEGPPFSVYHLATGRETSIRSLALLTLKVTGMEGHSIKYLPERQGEVGRNFSSSELAATAFNFRATTTLEVGLEQTWKWFLKHYSKT